MPYISLNDHKKANITWHEFLFVSTMCDGPEVLFNYAFCYLYVSQISRI